MTAAAKVAALAAAPRRRPRVPSLDRLIHERLRLGMLSALAVNQSLTFTELREVLEVTDGNLSDHARKLENAGYVRAEKSFAGRKPRTAYRLTPRGRQALRGYIESMQHFLQSMTGA
ncbi:MAG: winged helix-turn-helix domain-containing protein [Terriglobales bacterium]